MQLAEKLSQVGVVVPRLSSLWQQWTTQAQSHSFAAAENLTAQWLETWPSDPAVIESWNELARSSPTATAFHTPAWQHAMANAYLRAGRFRILTVCRGKRIVGVLPLQSDRGGVLQTPGSVLSDYLEPLIAANESAAVWETIFQALNQLPGTEIEKLILKHCRLDCVDQCSIQHAAREAGFTSHFEPTSQVARIPLNGDWEQYLGTLQGRDRKELRRKLNNAKTKAGAELFIAHKEQDVRNALERTFDFMRDAGGKRGLKAQWIYRPMFRQISGELVSAGRLQVYVLRLNGQDAAGLICLHSSKGPMLWNIAHDPQFARLSPGIVLIGMAIEASLRQGASTFDLLRGFPRYKSELGAQESPIHRITFTREQSDQPTSLGVGACMGRCHDKCNRQCASSRCGKSSL